MARAREVTIEPAARFDAAGAAVVRVRADELFEHADGVLDTGDVEQLRHMRVASRRLRAALEMFARAFDKNEHAAVLREVKRLADALGARRDVDVQIERLEALRPEVGAVDVLGLEALLIELRAEQAQANAALATALGDACERELEARLRALVEAVGA
jgi:CHAD domain-containing protein